MKRFGRFTCIPFAVVFAFSIKPIFAHSADETAINKLIEGLYVSISQGDSDISEAIT